jgi:hypothetical protein
MKSILITLLISLIFTQKGEAQEVSEAKFYYYEPLHWRILIPAGFNSVPETELEQMGKQGAEMVGTKDTLNLKINHGFLFAVSSDESHYMDAKVVPIQNGSSKEFFTSWERGLNLSLQSMQEGMPAVKFDTVSYHEAITGIIFYAHKLQMNFGESQHVAQYSFLAIIGNKAMSVNIVAMDPKKEKQLLTAFRTSTFGPKKGTYGN